MIKVTLTTTLTLGLLLCGNPSRIQASDTKITVKDGGSILMAADGLDSGRTWKVSHAELRHLNTTGVLSGLQITDGGVDQCKGDPTCGIDTTKPWIIKVIYNGRWVTLASLSANKGLHVKLSPKISLDQWQKTADANQREFGHGDGRYISTIKVNGSATSLCAGKGGCQIIVTYTAP